MTIEGSGKRNTAIFGQIQGRREIGTAAGIGTVARGGVKTAKKIEEHTSRDDQEIIKTAIIKLGITTKQNIGVHTEKDRTTKLGTIEGLLLGLYLGHNQDHLAGEHTESPDTVSDRALPDNHHAFLNLLK